MKIQWKQNKHVWFVTWGEEEEEEGGVEEEEEEEEVIQWGTVPPGFPCAELLPCAVLHDLCESAEQDLMGSLKHSHMEYRKLFTVHTATLRL